MDRKDYDRAVECYGRAIDAGSADAAVYEQRGLAYTRIDGGFEVSGTRPDAIGQLAFQAGIPLQELTAQAASLEDVFLELTEDAEQYRAEGSRR